MNLLKALFEWLSRSAFYVDIAAEQNHPDLGRAPALLKETETSSKDFCRMIEMQNEVLNDLNKRYGNITKEFLQCQPR